MKTAHSIRFAKVAFNSFPVTDAKHAEFEKEGREDFALYGDNAKNPYMGTEGDAWSRGYWGAVVATDDELTFFENIDGI